MWGDLNTRPMWLAQYNHDADFALIGPSVNPYGGKSWRAFYDVYLQPKASDQPAATITDLQASHASGSVRLTWTAPSGAERYFVVWSTRPISRTYTQDQSMRNFWSCEVVGTDLEPVAGQSQSLEFGGGPAGTRIYASIVTPAATAT